MRVNFCLVVVALLLMFGCQPTTPEDQYLTSKALFDSGEYSTAIVELKTLLSEEPDFANARELLGRAYLATGQGLSASKELQRAIELGKSSDLMLPLLAKSFYLQLDWESLAELKEQTALLANDARSQVMMLVLMADHFSGLDTEITNSAIGSLALRERKLIQSFKQLSVNNIENAKILLDELSTEAQQSLYFKELYADLLSAERDYQQSATIWSSIAEELPYYSKAKFKAAQNWLHGGEPELAQPYLSYLLDLNANSAYANYLQGTINMTRGEYAEAKLRASNAINNGLVNDTAKVLMGLASYKTGDLETSYYYLNGVNENLQGQLNIDRILAILQIQLGFPNQAIDSLNSLTENIEIDADLYVKSAELLIANGEYDEAAAPIKKARAIAPDNAEVALIEGMLSVNRDNNAAIVALQQSLELDTESTEAYAVLALAQVNTGDIESALETAKKWQASDPANGYNLEAIIYLRETNFDRAMAAVDKALVNEPRHTGALYTKLRIHLAQNQNDSVINVTKTIVNQNPNILRGLADFVKFSLLFGSPDDAYEFLNELSDSRPDAVNVVIAKAGLLMSTQQPLKAIALLEDKIAELSPAGLQILSDGYLVTGQTSKAKDLYQKWQQGEPGNMQPWIKLLALAERNNDYEEIIELSEKAATIFDNVPKFLVVQLHFQMSQKKWDAAFVTLNRIKKKNFEHDNLPYYDGWLALVNGNSAYAEQQLTLFYNRFPSFDSALMLAWAMEQNGKVDKAGKLLEGEASKQANNLAFKKRISDFYLNNDRDNKAKYWYQEILLEEPENYIALNNMALVEMRLGQTESASDYAQKALTLAPDNPYVIDTLGQLEMSSGNINDAITLFHKAFNLAPASKEIKMNLVDALKKAGRNGEAQAIITL